MYSEGDIFIGATVPQIRTLAKKFHKNSSFADLSKLLSSKIHDERLLALLILVQKFECAKNSKEKATIAHFYTQKNTLRGINNWDLVDLSCYKILGAHLSENLNELNMLHKFAASPNIWERRISVVSTWAFIRKNFFDPTIKIAEFLLKDDHDLVQKAVGWMLREIGKRDKTVLLHFLDTHGKKMSKMMLRYAVEKFSPEEREKYRIACR